MIDNQGKYKTRLWAINEGTGWVITPVTSGDLCIGLTYAWANTISDVIQPISSFLCVKHLFAFEFYRTLYAVVFNLTFALFLFIIKRFKKDHFRYLYFNS